MGSPTESIVVQVTPEEKAALDEAASRAGLSVGELCKLAVKVFDVHADPVTWEGLLDRYIESTERAIRSIDDTVAAAREADRRMEQLERSGK